MLLLKAKVQKLKAIHNFNAVQEFTDMLLLKAKVQKLKAIHNTNGAWGFQRQAVAKSKSTKIEGNSQHIEWWQSGAGCCC